jgi:hypothetical protein
LSSLAHHQNFTHDRKLASAGVCAMAVTEPLANERSPCMNAR